MLVAVNIAAIGAMGYLGAMFASAGGRHALAGLLVPGYFGLITSLSRDTAEPLAAACLLAGLLAVRARRPVLAAALLAYGALTRETVMVAVAAIAIMRVAACCAARPRPGRDDLAWLVPAVAFVAWQVVVKAATGSFPLLADGGRNAGEPFVAPLQALKSSLGHLNTHQFDQYDLWLLELAILALFAIAALLSPAVHERAGPRAAGIRAVPGRDLRRHAEHLGQPRRRSAVLHRGVPAGRDHPAGRLPGGAWGPGCSPRWPR